MPTLVDPATAGWAVASAPLHDAAACQALQRQRLTALLRHAVQASPYLAGQLRGLDPDSAPLHDLPVQHKRTLMRHFDDWVTDRSLTLQSLRRFVADPQRIGDTCGPACAVWESSGSRGEPGLFVHDAGALAVYDALEFQRPAPLRPLQRLWDPFWWGERVAFVGAIDGHFASQASLQRLCRRMPWLAERWRGFSILQPLPALLAELQAFAPTVLTTYPTAASMLAEAQADGRIALNLQEVWTGGETLGRTQRARITDVFDCPLRHSYGASEFLPLAAECREQALHVNADWVILEPVDARGRPVPPGELSHDTLLTNLANGVQPLIRYALGDRTRWRAGPCACGSVLPVIEVEGRCDDLLVLPGVDGTPVHLLPLALSTLREDEAGLFHFRLEQTGPSSLCLRLPGARTASACHAVQLLQRYAAEQGASPVQVRLHCGHPLPHGRSGKLQRVVSRSVFPASAAACAGSAPRRPPDGRGGPGRSS
ncbi:MAG: phenylacetate--CoA ligase family protein [Burkholderiaceae bacterium]|nr:phenylacetate--CoA ligase family protein [Rhodoferax sp.]MCP5270337.1 phenylacetate--CoA ligase family protein [Burkholderiaceae bacterium]